VDRPGFAAALRTAAAQGAGEEEGAAVVVFGAAAEVEEMAVRSASGKGGPAVAVGLAVEGAAVDKRGAFGLT